MVEISRRALLGGVAGTAAAALASSPAVAGPAVTAPAPAAAPWPGGVLDDEMSSGQAWKRFLADADLIWKRMPATSYEGPFLGNGFLASGIYREPDANAVRFNVQHSEVQDHRPEFGSLFGLARLPIGTSRWNRSAASPASTGGSTSGTPSFAAPSPPPWAACGCARSCTRSVTYSPSRWFPATASGDSPGPSTPRRRSARG